MIVSERDIRLLINESLEKKQAENVVREIIRDLINDSSSKLLSEDDIRDLVVEKLKAAATIGSAVRGAVGRVKSAFSDDDQYSGDLVVVRNGKKYIVDASIGISPPGFWADFRKGLEAHVNQQCPDLGLTVDNLGVTRDLDASGNPSSSARVAGSKHGAGVANDLYLHTEKYGRYTNFREDNKILSQDQCLVSAIRSHVAKYPDIVWGGEWEGGPTAGKRGTLEFHHFEFTGAKISSLFQKFDDEIAKTDYGKSGGSSASLTGTTELGKLYKALAESTIRDVIRKCLSESQLNEKLKASKSAAGDSGPAGTDYARDTGRSDGSEEEEESVTPGSFSGSTGGGGGPGDREKLGSTVVIKMPMEDGKFNNPNLVYVYPGLNEGGGAFGLQSWVVDAIDNIGSEPNTIVVVAGTYKTGWGSFKSDGIKAYKQATGKNPTTAKMVGWSGGANGLSQATGDGSLSAVWYADPSPTAQLVNASHGNVKMYYNPGNWTQYMPSWDTAGNFKKLAEKISNSSLIKSTGNNHADIFIRSMKEALA